MNLETLILYSIDGIFSANALTVQIFLPLYLCQRRIESIIPQTLPDSEELSKIKCCYFSSKEKFASLFHSRKLFKMVISPGMLDGTVSTPFLSPA